MVVAFEITDTGESFHALDEDGDAVHDACDNCSNVANGESEDAPADGDGDGGATRATRVPATPCP